MGRWTKEHLRLLATSYTNKTVFRKANRGAYNAIKRFGKEFEKSIFQDMACSPCPFKENIHLVYGYFFDDGSVYIGSTMNEHSRINEHHRRGPVFSKIKDKIPFVYKKLEENISINNVLIREQFFIDHYKSLNGYILINRCGANSRGKLDRKWTESTIKSEAAKYKNFSEWRKNSKSSFNAAFRLNMLEKFDNYYVAKKTTISDDEIISDALKYTTKICWRSNSGKMHDMAQRRKIIHRCCAHMTVLRNPWTVEDVISNAGKYKSLKEWKQAKQTSYYAACSMKILDLCRASFATKYRRRTDDEIIKDAKQFNSTGAWKKHDPSSYCVARRRQILNRCKSE
jgi:predicted GIY-YIG superfamily endonuclease